MRKVAVEQVTPTAPSASTVTNVLGVACVVMAVGLALGVGWLLAGDLPSPILGRSSAPPSGQDVGATPIVRADGTGAASGPAPTAAPVVIAPTQRAADSAASRRTAPASEAAPTVAGPAETLADTAASRGADEALQRGIEAAMADVVPDGSAVFISPDGRVVARHQSGVVRMAASTIKLPLVMEVLRQGAEGRLDFATPYTVSSTDVVGGSGELQRQVGRTLSLAELVRLAIVHSDNVAANTLLDKVGMERVNATMRDRGFPETRYERRFLDAAAQARGKENRVTADDLADMLRRLWLGELLGPRLDVRALELLKERGERDPDWLGFGLPPDTPLYHINGTLAGVRNDAAIVGLSPEDGYVLVVCQDRLENDAAGERAIAELARRVHALVTAPSDRLP